MVTAMMVNFLLMALSVLALPRRNPELATNMSFIRSRPTQIAIAGTGAVLLSVLIVAQVVNDVSANTPWYFHAFYLYGIVLAVAALIAGFFLVGGAGELITHYLGNFSAAWIKAGSPSAPGS